MIGGYSATEKGDVWSYGVVMWEVRTDFSSVVSGVMMRICSLAQPHISQVSRGVKRLRAAPRSRDLRLSPPTA